MQGPLFIVQRNVICHRTLSYMLVWKNYPIYGPRREKTCLRGFANNKGADQPAHQRSLIITFVIRLLKSIISRLVTSEISLFYLVSVAKGDWFESSFVGNPEGRFSQVEAHIIENTIYIGECL